MFQLMRPTEKRDSTHPERPPSVLCEAGVRRVLLLIGAILLLVALLPEARHLSDPQLGRSQWLLIGVSGVILLMGLLGNRVATVYRTSAFVLLNTVIALILVELTSTAANMALGTRGEPTPVEFAMARANPYFLDKPWADEFWEEQGAAQKGTESYHPYVIWRGAPFEGRYVRVDKAGFRHTPGGTCTDDAYNIVMFGSSALWGWGVPDASTIPAFVQAKLQGGDRPICVRNLAQNAFVSTQDLIELVRLVQGGDRIDLAVFFHGFNDASALFETKDAGAHYMVEKIAARMTGKSEPRGLRSFLATTATGKLVSRIMRRNDAVPPPRWSLPEVEVPQKSREALRAYLTNLDVIRGLSARAGFDVAFFWQPYSGWGVSPEELKDLPGAGSFDGRQQLIRSVYDAARDAAKSVPDLHFMADSFVGIDPSVWLDYVHLAPAGNERVADLILEALADVLPSQLSNP
jgi:lysophospholipase L1-like esterase